MLRSTLRKLAKSLTSTSRRPARPPTRRPSLTVEGLEDRMVLSTATLAGSTLLITADPGTVIVKQLPTAARPALASNIIINPITFVRTITIKADPAVHSNLDVLDNGTLLGKFPIASIKSVAVSLAGLDAVNVDDSNGLPFAAGANISLFGSGSNSLSLTGSRVISGIDSYAAGSGTQAGTLLVGGMTFQFSGAITSVTDTVKTTGSLFAMSFGEGVGVTLSGQNGVTQTLTGLADGGGGGGTLTFGNKPGVVLELFGLRSSARLGATAAAAGEQSFAVDLFGGVDPFGGSQALFIDATPSTVVTTANVPTSVAVVELNANAGRVVINGNSKTLVNVGVQHNQTTSGIKADVFVNGAESILIDNANNTTTQEHVTVTESTVSGTGLFGNNAAVLHYSGLAIGPLAGLSIDTGSLHNTYTVVGSRPGARFTPDKILIVDEGVSAGLSVLVAVDSGSGLNLSLLNYEHVANGTLFISALHGTVNPSAPPFGEGTETVTFPGGLNSTVFYSGFSSVSHS